MFFTLSYPKIVSCPFVLLLSQPFLLRCRWCLYHDAGDQSGLKQTLDDFYHGRELVFLCAFANCFNPGCFNPNCVLSLLHHIVV